MRSISKSRLLKFADSVLGRLIVLLMPSAPFFNSAVYIRSVLLIRPGGIGDALLLLPLINSLINSAENLEITILFEKRNSGVGALLNERCKVCCYDSPTDLLKVMLKAYDCVIDSEQSHYLSAVVARIVRAPVKIGFATNSRKKMFTHGVPYSQDDYELNSFLKLLMPMQVLTELPEKFLELKPLCYLDNLSIPKDDFITIFPGASINEREWGAEKFRVVAELLLQFGIRVAVIGGKNEISSGDIITLKLDGSVNFAGRTTIAETARIIESSLLLLTADSGMLHLATALGKRTVALFGPGREKKWGHPDKSRHITINLNLDCSPCTTFGETPECIKGAPCMQLIRPETVFNAISILLSDKLNSERKPVKI